jgi:signal peptide peptidase SppA
MKDITTAIESPSVHSIVLNIDSPGGEAFGIHELAQAIFDARGKKPIKAYISGLGCSGAYWIASSADEVITDKSSFLGSIGVVTAWMDDKEFYAMMGIRREVVTSSNAPYKRLDFDNEEHRAELQRELDSLEKVFHKAVARNRKVTVEQVINDFNKGGVLAGADAVKAGMADRTGSLEEVIKGLQRENKTKASVGAHKETDMGFREDFKSFASKLGFKVEDEQHKPEDETQTAPEPGEDPKAPAAEPAKEDPPKSDPPKEDPKPDAGVEAQFAAFKEQTFVSEAAAFVDAEVKAGRLYPAEKEAVTNLFVQAARDDDKSPLTTGSRLETLKAQQAARTPHGLDKETVSVDANELFILALGNSEKSDMRKAADAQVANYVATVNPTKRNLEAVK